MSGLSANPHQENRFEPLLMSTPDFNESDSELPAPETSDSGVERPFQVVVRPSGSRSTDSEAEPDRCEDVSDAAVEFEEELSLDEIEAAYLRALEAADYVETVSSELLQSESPIAEEALSEEATGSETLTPESVESETDEISLQSGGGSTPSGQSESVSEPSTQINVGSTTDVIEQSDEPIVSAEQVVEALLFVGGAPLPIRKFQDVLGGAHTPEQVETMIDSLNARYRMQQRPYQVALVEGGYQLQLLSEFESIRSRAYGHGPKEVKLAQDALEVLAFVAYRQPVKRDDLQEIEKPNVSGLIRQLLRRQLIYIDRSDPECGEQYRTTDRFLEVFGLTSLEDLPQAGTFNYR